MSSLINMMYHFVGIDKKFKGTTLKDFNFQLDYLQKNYENNKLFLTFDHGTIDHYEIVRPELEKRNLKGIFFIMTIVPEEAEIPSIDKQRFLEGNYRKELVTFVCDQLNLNYCPIESKTYLKHLTFYSDEERHLRFLRDTIIPKIDFEKVITKIFNSMFGNEKDFVKNNYLDWTQIKRLKDDGHIIGSHSHSHVGNFNDYKKSFELLDNNLKIENRLISYPNGNNLLNDIELKELNINSGYISNNNGDTMYNIGRIDDKFFNLVKSLKD